MTTVETSKHSEEAPTIPRKEVALRFLEEISPLKIALLIFITGMAVSCLLTWVARPLAKINLPLGADAYDGYWQLAQNLFRGNGYVFEPGGHKVFHRPPLYPLLLAPGAWLPEFWGRFYVAGVNSLLLAASTLVVRKLGMEWFNKRVGTISWIIFGFSPFLLWSVKNPMAPICQTLSYLLIINFSWQCWKAINAKCILRPALRAGLLGSCLAGVMCHGTMLLVSGILLSILCVLSVGRAHWQALRALFTIVLLLIVTILPWTWRNYKVTGLFLPIAGNSGLAYFAGNARWGITEPAAFPGEDKRQAALRHAGFGPEDHIEMLQFWGFKDPEFEKLANERYKKHIQEHPLAFLKKVMLNSIDYYFPLFYYLFPPAGTYAARVPVMTALKFEADQDTVPVTLYHLILLPLSISGCWYLWRRKSTRFQAGLLLFGWGLYALPYFPFLTFVGHALYTFGTIPFLAIAASVRLTKAIEHERAEFRT